MAGAASDRYPQGQNPTQATHTESTMTASRRTFFGRLAAATALVGARPSALFAARRSSVTDDQGLPTPPPGPLPSDFWQDLRKEFLIPAEEAFFNTGTLGSSPRIVRDAVIQHMNHVDRD